MPSIKRIKCEGYKGVYYIQSTDPITRKPDRIYYIRYRKRVGGKLRQIDEKAGRKSRDMTPARASGIRALRIAGKELSNAEKRVREEKEKRADEEKWTIDRLAEEYFSSRPDNKGKSVDEGRYEKYVKDTFGKKEPYEILALDIKRFRKKLKPKPSKNKKSTKKLLKKLSPQTEKHILNLFTWIVNYGVKNNLCTGLSFHVKKPTVNNQVTEDLTNEQLKNLLQAIENGSNIQIANMMKFVLYTGMRRGELFKLKWKDIKFELGFMLIADPKGGPDQKIPLNDAARDLLKNHPKVDGSRFVFPGKNGKQRVTAQAAVNKIKKAAGLPDDFRPLHGLRHAYASMLASSGKVDMYVLQRLLTHKDFRMTQRYAHLRDEAMKRGSEVAGSLIEGAAKAEDKDDNKVVNIENHKK